MKATLNIFGLGDVVNRRNKGTLEEKEMSREHRDRKVIKYFLAVSEPATNMVMSSAASDSCRKGSFLEIFVNVDLNLEPRRNIPVHLLCGESG
jgi:hypothetical protein